MNGRKILFETYFGSKLYGTNRPDSDDDFLGVYLPDIEEFFSFSPIEDEWKLNEKLSAGPRNTKGDTDRKYTSLREFLRLLASGQSGQIEMIFSPKHLWLQSSPTWEKILANKEMFLSQDSIVSFLKFAKSQAEKAVLKGENLNLVQYFIETLEPTKLNRPLLETLPIEAYNKVQEVLLEDNTRALDIAGKSFQLSLKTSDALKRLKKMESEYGTRTRSAAASGYDFKSLSHAYRLVAEAEEFITTGKLVLPYQNPVLIEKLKMIRKGEYQADYFAELDAQIARIKTLPSPLKKSVDMKQIEEFSVQLHKELYFSKKNLWQKICLKISTLFSE